MGFDAFISSAGRVLDTDDPPPVDIVNPTGRAAALLVCDHASNAVPRRLAHLGLDDAALGRHIAWDIGAAAVARDLAAQLDAPAVLAGYSRLVLDMNRDPGDPTAICVISDRSIVPGNRDLSAADRAARIEELFDPYHDAIAQALAARDALAAAGAGSRPALISLHSFTPVIAGWGHERQERPWHIGILHHHDHGLASALLAALHRRDDLVIGDNQPYSARNGHGYTLARHAEASGRPNVEIELRQDLIADPAGAARMATILAEALTPLLSHS